MSYRHKHINPKIRNLRPKKRIWKSPVFWVGVLVLVVVMGIFYLAFFSSKFQVQSIEISGNAKAETTLIDALALARIQKKVLGINHKSIFFVDIKRISQDILQALPVIKSARVSKKYPNTIMVDVIERNHFATFCGGRQYGECFSIDKTGVIFENARPEPAGSLVLTSDARAEYVLGAALIPTAMMEAIAKIQEDLQHNFQINIKEALVSSPLIIKTAENWKLYFDPDSDMQSQITKMNLLLKDQITPSARKNLQYIYLQYKDRAYYK